MGLTEQLTRWIEAGLVTDEQARDISRFEAERAKQLGAGRATRAIALLGALTIVSGVGSLIAYNWAHLGPWTKLVGMALLLLASAAFALRSASHRNEPARLEVALVLHTGLTLAGLALVSQIYDHDGELWHLLAIWCALTAPAMFLTTTRIASSFWYGALFFTLMTSADDLSSAVRETWDLPMVLRGAFVSLILGTACGVLAARFAASQHLGRAAVGRVVLQIELISLGAIGGLMWLHGASAGAPLFVLLALACFALQVVSLPRESERLGWGGRAELSVLVGLGMIGFALPAAFPSDSGFAAFVSFVAFFYFAWFLAERQDREIIARLAVFALGARVVIASFELFEDLFVTGTVLVALGVGAVLWSRHRWTKQPSHASEGASS
jgi:uncharacterized membrane protein